jgi:hypothetical protein
MQIFYLKNLSFLFWALIVRFVMQFLWEIVTVLAHIVTDGFPQFLQAGAWIVS